MRRSQAGIPWSGRSAGCWQQDGLWKSDNDVWKLRKIYDDEHLDINLALTLSCHPKIAPATTSTEPLRGQGKKGKKGEGANRNTSKKANQTQTDRKVVDVVIE